jgi:nucleoid-associated protein YgaU
MAYRYATRRTFVNKNESYREFLKDRGLREFRQFDSPDMKYPSVIQMASLTTVKHIWKMGDRYFKLAHQHYGDSNLWWVIAWFNKKPTEGHLQYGDMVRIPFPLEKVLSYYGV